MKRNSFGNQGFPKWLVTVCLCLTLLPVGASGADNQNKKKTKPTDDNAVELGLVVKAIELALDVSQQSPVAGFPDLQSATVKVQTTLSKEGGGKVTLYVFNIGGKYGVQNVSSMTLELKPPPRKGSEVSPSSVNVEEIKDAIAKEVQAAKLAFLSAATNAKTLKTDKIEISVQFSVSKNVEGGVDTAKLFPVGISVNGKLQRDSGNTITLVFATK